MSPRIIGTLGTPWKGSQEAVGRGAHSSGAIAGVLQGRSRQTVAGAEQEQGVGIDDLALSLVQEVETMLGQRSQAGVPTEPEEDPLRNALVNLQQQIDQLRQENEELRGRIPKFNDGEFNGIGPDQYVEPEGEVSPAIPLDDPDDTVESVMKTAALFELYDFTATSVKIRGIMNAVGLPAAIIKGQVLTVGSGTSGASLDAAITLTERTWVYIAHNRVTNAATLETAAVTATAPRYGYPNAPDDTAANSYIYYPLWLLWFKDGVIVPNQCCDITKATQWQAGA